MVIEKIKIPKIEKIKGHAHNIKNEFKKQTATAIMAAFGLIIALSWKDVITLLVDKFAFVKEYGSIVTAVILTAVSVLGILLVSRWANSGVKN